MALVQMVIATSSAGQLAAIGDPELLTKWLGYGCSFRSLLRHVRVVLADTL